MGLSNQPLVIYCLLYTILDLVVVVLSPTIYKGSKFQGYPYAHRLKHLR